MEGVMAIPGVGVQPGGSESDMQTAGTAARNNSYAAFDAAQGQATESAGGSDDYAAGLKALGQAHRDRIASTPNDEMAFQKSLKQLYRDQDALDKQHPEQRNAYVRDQNDKMWSKDDWKSLGGNRSAVDETMDGEWDLEDLVAAFRAGKITNQEYESHLEDILHPEEDDYTDYTMRQGEMGNPDRMMEKSASEKQARFMAAAAHDPKFAKKAGISQGVAKEFNQADTGTKQLSKAMKHKNECSMMENGMEQEYSPEVQQAMADFENVVMNLGMAPEDAFDRITQRLSQEGMNEFRAAIEASGKFDDQDEQDVDNFVTGYLNGNRPAVDEKIELGDHDDSPAWYIYDQNKKICGGPFESEMEANRASRGYHWFNYGDHEIQPGFDVDGQFVPDDYDEINSSQNTPAMEEAFDLQNGYDDINDASGNDYFPSGADSPVVKDTGPSGARQGDNPEQKKMQIGEVHKELVYGYRNFLKESLLTELSKKTLRSYAKKSSADAEEKMWNGDKKAKSGDTKGALKDWDKMDKRNKGEIKALKKSGDIKD